MGDIKAFADSLVRAREEYEESERAELLLRMERLLARWRSATYVGFDATLGSEYEIAEGFQKALDLLSECHEELSND